MCQIENLQVTCKGTPKFQNQLYAKGFKSNSEKFYTCSGAPLLALCILPELSMYVSAVLLSVGLNGSK